MAPDKAAVVASCAQARGAIVVLFGDASVAVVKEGASQMRGVVGVDCCALSRRGPEHVRAHSNSNRHPGGPLDDRGDGVAGHRLAIVGRQPKRA